VSGEGSTWNNTKDLLVGYKGKGDLKIENGGTVSDFDGYLG